METNNSNFIDNYDHVINEVLTLVKSMPLTVREIHTALEIDKGTMDYIIGYLRKWDMIYKAEPRRCTISVGYKRDVNTWSSDEAYKPKPKYVTRNIFEEINE